MSWSKGIGKFANMFMGVNKGNKGEEEIGGRGNREAKTNRRKRADRSLTGGMGDVVAWLTGHKREQQKVSLSLPYLFPTCS